MKRALVIIQGLLMAFASIFVVSLLYTVITNLFMLITGVNQLNTEVDYCLMVMAVMISIIPFYIWYKKFVSHRQVESIDLKDVFSIKNIGIYLMLGIGCQLFISGVLTKLRPLFETLFSYYDQTMSGLFTSDPILVAAYVIVLAPIMEELIMRGILFNRLRYEFSFFTANLIQALVFGIYHLDIVQGIYAFVLGLILGYVYEKTRTLLSPILLHIVINASGFLLPFLPFGKYIDIWLQICIGCILLFVALHLFRNNNRSNKDI